MTLYYLYCRKRINNKTQLERRNILEDNHTNNKLKMSDGRIYDVNDILEIH